MHSSLLAHSSCACVRAGLGFLGKAIVQQLAAKKAAVLSFDVRAPTADERLPGVKVRAFRLLGLWGSARECDAL